MDSILKEPSAARVYSELYPNGAPRNMMTPSGWGGYGMAFFGGVGGTYPQVYSHKPDMGVSAGFCVGNPVKAVNLAIGANMFDVHKFRDFSANIILSRKIFKGSSISVGGLGLFYNASQTDAPAATYYVSFSHAVQTVSSKTPGASALSYTIGIGNGRFLLKSPADIAAGRGAHGTAVFGGVSYELIKRTNLNVEWSGQNLGCSLGLRPFRSLLSVGIGVDNLTRYTADKPSLLLSLGYPLSLTR
ncbi:MAG TPA: hypothetical protein VIM55_12440 [Mucilaginibacter sp.]